MSRPIKANPDKLIVSGRDVPSIGEQHFYDSAALKHIDDPALKEAIVDSDDEAEPVTTKPPSLLSALPGGTKIQYLLSGLSVDETRLSALIICLLLSIIFGGVVYFVYGDISANLTTIITTLIYAIAGVNISNSVINHFVNRPPNTPSKPPRS